jgi:hypothetical protein
MELNGGSLVTDPLSGRLLLNGKYFLDYMQGKLTDRTFPYAVSADHVRKQTEIMSGADVVYRGNGLCIDTCLSASGRYFAYSLRSDYDLPTEIFAIFEGGPRPIKIAQGSLAAPIGWIE